MGYRKYKPNGSFGYLIVLGRRKCLGALSWCRCIEETMDQVFQINIVSIEHI